MKKWESAAPVSAALKRKREQRAREAKQRESTDAETKRAAQAKRERELQDKREASARRRQHHVWLDEDWCCDFGAAHNRDNCLKPFVSLTQPAGEWYVWICEECNWAMCRMCCKAPGVYYDCKHALICVDHDGDIIDNRPSR